MDLAGNAGISLADLEATAPRGFDKQLVRLIAAVQDGARPIVTPQPLMTPVAPRYDDSALHAQAADMRLRLDQLIAAYQQLQADYAQMVAMMSTHTHVTVELETAEPVGPLSEVATLRLQVDQLIAAYRQLNDGYVQVSAMLSTHIRETVGRAA